ncbi:variable surface protein Vir12 [Plasmodium vivax India VII]|uniref:Variable surface protein Vir12 n=1 Tax=Plasmodium vivax India VII TaxID=1077284 RepID=A0A0J9SF65_PLAVI|nr:variable surface protein Vir12 [Plasmodium vivax India VII]
MNYENFKHMWIFKQEIYCEGIINGNFLFIIKGDILKELTSHKIYEHFDKEDDRGNKYDNDCEIKIKEKVLYPEFQKICKKFAKNLEDIFCNKYGEKTINYCILLEYWVYEQIKKIPKTGEKKNEIFFLTEKLKKVQYSIKKNCSENFECYDYYNDYFGDWKDEKELYEYFLNFDEIDSNIDKKEDVNENYKRYLKHILDLYKKKKKSGCCNIKYYHLCDHYFRCNPKYDPEVLLSKLGEPKGENPPSKSDKDGIDVSAEIGENKKYVDAYGKHIQPTRTDVVIPDVPLGWHKRKDKYKSRIQNVRCLMNYTAKNSKYALVSCYNFGKGYPDVEHIFRPTKEEDAFFSELKNKGKGHYDNLSSSVVYRKSFPEGSNKNERGATQPNITAVMPASIHGYSPLGQLIKEEQDEYTEEPQKSRAFTYRFAPTARSYLNEEEFNKIPCIYIKINENGTKECVKKEDLDKIKVFTDKELQNLGTEETVATSPATDSHADESLVFFETIGDIYPFRKLDWS